MSNAAIGLTRRRALQLAGAGALSASVTPWAWAAGKTGLHGLSVFGDLKYPAGFTQFDYVNANAPKGGRMNFQPPNWYFNQNVQTFNTLNSFVLRGDAPPRMEFVFDTLMMRAADEPDALYGLLAETVDVSEDGNVFTFHLRPEARFHDGSPLTAEDVAFSFMLIKKDGHPNLSQIIREMDKAEAADPATVVVTLTGKQSRDTILTVAGLPVFSKAFYTANDFLAGTLTPPLGSGAYKVGRVSAGRFIEYERVDDYWGRDLPVNAGQNNFDVIRVDFFTERQTAFEAFKKGEITYREEFTSITWAQDYNFPAIVQGKVLKSLFPGEKRPSYQGWFINTRRGKFRDPRTREAIGLAFDFEWSNRNLFFDAYTRLASYFEKSDFAATGMPTPEELALLEPFRAELPPEVFGEAYVPPKSDGSGRDRKLLRKASELLAAAGLDPDRQQGHRRGRRAAGGRVPDRCRRLRARARALRRQPQAHRRRCVDPAGRPGADAVAAERLRLRRGDVRVEPGPHAARRFAADLRLDRRGHPGHLQSLRHQGAGGRRTDRKTAGGAEPG